MLGGIRDLKEREYSMLYEDDGMESDPEPECYLDIPPPMTRRRSSSLPDEETCMRLGSIYTMQMERKATMRKKVKKLLKRQKVKPGFISQEPSTITMTPSGVRQQRPKFNNRPTDDLPNKKPKETDLTESEDESPLLFSMRSNQRGSDSPTTQSKRGYWRKNKDGSSFFIGSGSESEMEMRDYYQRKRTCAPHNRPGQIIKKQPLTPSSDGSDEDESFIRRSNRNLASFACEEVSNPSSDSDDEVSLLERDVQPKNTPNKLQLANWEKIKTFINSGASIFDGLKKDEQNSSDSFDQSSAKLSSSVPHTPGPITTRKAFSRRRRSSSLSSLEGAVLENKQEEPEEERRERKISNNIFTLAIAMIKKSRNTP